MRTLWLLFLAASILCVAGCNDVVSLAPLYDDATLIFEADLVGSWREDANTIWTFGPSDKKMYRLLVLETHEDGTGTRTEETALDAGLLRLSGKLFLDLMSDDSGPTGAPAHRFARIDIQNDVLRLSSLDSEWLKKQLERDPYVSYFAAPNGTIVFTAPTRDLQYFFRVHAWNNEAFPSSGPTAADAILTRIK